MDSMAAERLSALEEALEGFNTVRTLLSKYRKQATGKIERLMKDVNEGRERCLVKLRRVPKHDRTSSAGSGESKFRQTQFTNLSMVPIMSEYAAKQPTMTRSYTAESNFKPTKTSISWTSKSGMPMTPQRKRPRSSNPVSIRSRNIKSITQANIGHINSHERIES